MNTVVLGYGLLGKEIVRQTGWDYLSRERNGIDITDMSTYQELIPLYDQVINCIGYTNTYSPHKEPSWSVNYLGAAELKDLCDLYDIKLVHISTDYIYAQTRSEASESDIPIHFNNWYTYSKLLADAYIQNRGKESLIIRTSFKPRPFPWEEAWVDLIGNFDYVDVIAKLIIDLVKREAVGIYNVGTAEKSMYDLAVQTKPNIRGIEHWHEPFDVTMNLDKLKSL